MNKGVILGVILVSIVGLGYFVYDTLNPVELKILDNDEDIEKTNSELQDISEEESEIISENPDTSGEEKEDNLSLIGTVIGTIVDDSGNPLGEVLVEVGEVSTTTYANGSYIISVPEGTFYIEVSKDGYSQDIELVQILENVTSEISFCLRTLSSGSGEGKTIDVLTHGHGSSDEIDAIEEAFLNSDLANDNNIVNVGWMLSNPELWNKTIRNYSEGIDIIWGGEIILYDYMLSDGLIAPLEGDQIVSLLEPIPEQNNGTDVKRVIDGKVYWVVINDEPIALLNTSNDPQLAILFIEWVITQDTYAN